jgi:hypothetical protein
MSEHDRRVRVLCDIVTEALPAESDNISPSKLEHLARLALEGDAPSVAAERLDLDNNFTDVVTLLASAFQCAMAYLSWKAVKAAEHREQRALTTGLDAEQKALVEGAAEKRRDG